MKASTSTRLTIVDVLRGYFLFAIVINHIKLFPNLFSFLTGESRLWVSFAEGFFFISGFILAYNFRHQTITNLDILKKSWSRMLKIYLWSVFLTLEITTISNFLPAGTAKDGLWIMDGYNFLELTKEAFTLRYVYGFADFLAYYAIYLFFAPLLFVLLRRFGAVVVIIISLLIWIFRGSNVYMAQQIVFVLGILFGSNFSRIQKYYTDLNSSTKLKLQKIIIVIFLSTLALSIFSSYFLKGFLSKLSEAGTISVSTQAYLQKKNDVLSLMFDKRTMGVGRLLLDPIWYGALLIIFTRYDKYIRNLFGGVFERWGRNSLSIFIIHSILLIPIPILMKYLPGNFLTNTVISFTVLYVIDRLIKLKYKHLPAKTIMD